MKTKKHRWWVNTQLFAPQLACTTKDMETARRIAYQKLIAMPYKEFVKYVSLNVSGSQQKRMF